jgi:steroid 5-alpha reductase family enzyme
MSAELTPLGPFALFAVAVMTLVWLLQLRTQNAGYVDAAWAIMLGTAALYFAWEADGDVALRGMIAVMGGLWGFRLGLHLLARVLHEPEDGRYAHLREHWRGHQGKFFGFFMLQALLTVLFALPFLAVAQNQQPPSSPWVAAAIGLWLTSLIGESIADRQLATFRADPRNRGRTCRAGLWRYSRHPNYFFEWLHWFAYVLLALGSPLFWFSVAGPVLMFLSLRFFTGVPYVEAQSLRSRGDDYRDYQRSTNAFFPWPPRVRAGADSGSPSR